MQLVNHSLEEIKMPAGVPSVIRGQLVGVIGHERHLRRADIRYQCQKLLRRVALYIQLCGHHGLQLIDIFLTDMPLIRAGMHRDTLCAEQLAVHGKTLNVRHITATRVAQCGDFIDVYT